jgi:putative intracellular protease/amidase
VKNKILIIVTNADEYHTVGLRTGLWLGELVHFWDVAEEAGFAMDIASPAGGKIPLDPESLTRQMLDDLGTRKRYLDRAFMDRLKDTMKISAANVDDYDAIYLTGGHGVMFDFPQSEDLEDLIAKFLETGRVVSTVCHGAAGLLNVTLGDGEPLVKGRRVTGFSWREEELADRAEAVPYNVEEGLNKLGADYSTAAQPFASYVVEDGRLITGQNPASARAVAEAVVKRLAAE